ncbi:MAG TPA: M14 family murein peptide amidase A [Phycisphaerae bacterium]|nr:M14 family murein peptide amidase A [Phycisphaerae bacterium]HNU45210.1 M14 family murein peptide amidase A [Phycisphaerae bacterium]
MSLSTTGCSGPTAGAGLVSAGQWHTVGTSVLGEPIRAYVIAPGGRTDALIMGGCHGDEPKSVYVVQQLIAEISEGRAEPPPQGCVLLPVVNPDGYTIRRRRNAHGVDINRNFPTANWAPGRPRSRMFGGEAPQSEPETRAVMEVVQRFRPRRIVSVHSIDRQRQCNNYDGPAEDWAALLAAHNGYPVTGSIGYATPGSFGTWSGVEQGIPTVTLELPSHHSPQRCWYDNREALLAFLTGASPDTQQQCR